VAEPATHQPEPAGALGLEITRPAPDVALLAVRGELDTLTAPELDTALRELLDGLDGPALRPVVDLSRVTFLASSGLAVLIQAAHRADAESRVLHLVVSSRAVLRPLEVTGSDQLFTLHPDLDTAVAG
jgi:anti-sigma B factor antagonist